MCAADVYFFEVDHMRNPFCDLTKFERRLYALSLVLVTISFLFATPRDILNLIASLIGVTALIFVAKGYVIGQILIVIFSVFYGIISFYFRYYGEVITYLCMTAPIAAMSAIAWFRHPFQETKEVEVHRLTGRQWAVMLILAVAVTTVFYFILGALGTARLLFSTLSVTTSFIAAWLTMLRSPLYAVGYAVNDLVLIVLWVIAAVKDPSSLPMVACFLAFFLNDSYGFINWRRMERKQAELSGENP
jgi:nicotinamide mononucleotide transporter PnuC